MRPGLAVSRCKMSRISKRCRKVGETVKGLEMAGRTRFTDAGNYRRPRTLMAITTAAKDAICSTTSPVGTRLR